MLLLLKVDFEGVDVRRLTKPRTEVMGDLKEGGMRGMLGLGIECVLRDMGEVRMETGQLTNNNPGRPGRQT